MGIVSGMASNALLMYIVISTVLGDGRLESMPSCNFLCEVDK